MKFPLLLCALGALSIAASAPAAEEFYVGTYTSFFGSKGVYHFAFDERAGRLATGQLAATTANPSFVSIHPNGRWLYAVNEQDKGLVSAFAIGADRRLQPLSQESAKGGGPCHITLDAGHRFAFVANYGSGSVTVLPIAKDGRLGPAVGFDQQHGKGPNVVRQEGPHAHCVNIDSSNRFLYSCDLGNDRVEGYRFDSATGAIRPSAAATARLAGGSGPRHLVFHPRGYVYVINELANTVTLLDRDPASGSLRARQTVSSLPVGFKGENTTAEIALHPNGRFLYGSNRGHDSIAVFAIGRNGRLKLVQHMSTGGRMPRNFALDPSGRWLIAANQKSNSLVVFAIDKATGLLTPTGQKIAVGAPVCVAFMPVK